MLPVTASTESDKRRGDVGLANMSSVYAQGFLLGLFCQVSSMILSSICTLFCTLKAKRNVSRKNDKL